MIWNCEGSVQVFLSHCLQLSSIVAIIAMESGFTDSQSAWSSHDGIDSTLYDVSPLHVWGMSGKAVSLSSVSVCRRSAELIDDSVGTQSTWTRLCSSSGWYGQPGSLSAITERDHHETGFPQCHHCVRLPWTPQGCSSGWHGQPGSLSAITVCDHHETRIPQRVGSLSATTERDQHAIRVPQCHH
jgi:hypothetical protein